MTAESNLEDLQRRLNAVVIDTCNTVGCDNCGLKFGGYGSRECSATDLQGRILDIEMRQH